MRRDRQDGDKVAGGRLISISVVLGVNGRKVGLAKQYAVSVGDYQRIQCFLFIERKRSESVQMSVLVVDDLWEREDCSRRLEDARSKALAVGELTEFSG